MHNKFKNQLFVLNRLGNLTDLLGLVDPDVLDLGLHGYPLLRIRSLTRRSNFFDLIFILFN